MLAGGLAAVLALSGAGLIGYELSSNGSSTAATGTQTPTMRTISSDASPSNIYANAKDAVTFIVSDLPEGQATGTGFVVTKDGYIVTNDHVVDNATSVKVMLGTSKQQHDATVVGVDPSRDLALLKIDAGNNLKTLSLGDSSKVGVGDSTYAIGNPFGLDSTLTTGIVSALNRDIQAPDGATISGALQTDAAINPGNSGGPLLDSAGQVIGVNSQIATGGNGNGNVGIGFAIPANTVKDFVAQAKTGKLAPAPVQGQQEQPDPFSFGFGN
jgi:putative serine protease PepD